MPESSGKQRSGGIDAGVAATGYVCQNEPEHPDDRPEVLMVSSGPGEIGVICPECGRMAAGPDDEIPYGDPPYEQDSDPLTSWIERNRGIVEGNPSEYARGYSTCLNRLEAFIQESRRRKYSALFTESDREDEDLVTDGGQDVLKQQVRSDCRKAEKASYPFARWGTGVGSYRILDSVERRLSDARLQDLKRRLYQAIQYFPELDSETVTVGVNQDPENRDYDRWNPYASAESVNFLIRIPTHEEVSNVTLFHELAHLAIHVLDVHGEDVPASSEEFCSIFAIARQPVQLIDEDRIPYLGSPRAPYCDWPAICRDALAYRDERGANSHYIQYCRERLEVGSYGGGSA